MGKIRIGLVEDEMIIAADLRTLIADLGYECAEPCGTYEEAVQMLESYEPGLVILDINIGSKRDGIELAKYIREHTDIPIIFLTANSDAATLDRAKTVRPNAFLTKPFQKTDIYIAVEIALSNFISTPSENKKEDQTIAKDSIFIKDGPYFHKVKFDDITMLSSEHVYVTVHTAQKKFLVRTSLQEYLEKFDSSKIVRVHQRYAVNINKVDKINAACLIIENQEIPVSKSYHQALMAQLQLG